MDKLLKKIVNHNIEEKCCDTDANFSIALEKNPEVAARFHKNTVEFQNVYSKLKEVLPEEYKDLLFKLDSLSAALSADQDLIMFKEGLICGIKDLNYLSEIPDIDSI